MTKTLLVTRPQYDDCTSYLSHFSSLVLKEAKKLQINTKDFDGEKANSKNVSKFVGKQDPKLIFINGHGDSDSLGGHKGEILFSITKDIDLLKDKLVYARACHAGIAFGEKMVKGNGGCFIGYTMPFSFWTEDKHSATPLKDNTAKLFLEPSNEIVISLINGYSAQASHERSKEMMVENMRKILKMEAKKEPGAMGWLEVLWNNYEGQILHGNRNFRF